MLYNYHLRSWLLLGALSFAFSCHQSHAHVFKSDKSKHKLRIAWYGTEIAAGTILAFYSLYEIDKKFHHGLLNGIFTILKNTTEPKVYPTISASIAAGVCIHNGIEGLRKEL